MVDVNLVLEKIETRSNDISAKIEILKTLEEQKINIDEEITKAKDKLKGEAITKFTYATMQELNQKNMEENTNYRKKVWNDIAEIINEISDNLNTLKEMYNQKTAITDAPNIETKK